MHESSPVADFLNRILFDPIAQAMGIHLGSGHHAVPDHIVMILLVALGLIAFSWWLKGRLSIDNPSGMQHLVEVSFQAVRTLMSEVIGKESDRFIPIIGTLAIYILAGNLLGMIPGLLSPTSNYNITAACAICVFFYYNYQGFRKQGFLGYLKHFAGPVIWMAPFLFIIELISHMARPMSLSIRLFGNIFAEELIIQSLNNIFPFLVSIIVMFLALFASTIQAFIFILLTMVYISGAVEETHHEEHPVAAHKTEVPTPAV
jgi:F-type H+-transporting ATPase subunit a